MTYVHARRFVYYGRPMEGEFAVDNMEYDEYIQERAGTLHVHKGQLYLNCWTPGTVYRFDEGPNTMYS